MARCLFTTREHSRQISRACMLPVILQISVTSKELSTPAKHWSLRSPKRSIQKHKKHRVNELCAPYQIAARSLLPVFLDPKLDLRFFEPTLDVGRIKLIARDCKFLAHIAAAR